MIATTLCGGLGNQLFMYAAARAMALRNNTELVVNIHSGFENDKEYKRHYELDKFNVQYRKNKVLTFDYPCGNIVKALSRKLGLMVINPSYKFIADLTVGRGIDERCLSKSTPNAYLEGYWQSERYFADYSLQIKEDLRFVEKISDDVLENEKCIFCDNNRETPVCVGVRTYQEVHHKMSFDKTGLDFYIRAMDYIKSNVENPAFYVFSQDKDWCDKQLLSLKDYDIKLVSEHSAYDDLYLMTKFKYHIISNSSLYWWGAWLADGSDVIASGCFLNGFSICKGWKTL